MSTSESIRDQFPPDLLSKRIQASWESSVSEKRAELQLANGTHPATNRKSNFRTCIDLSVVCIFLFPTSLNCASLHNSVTFSAPKAPIRYVEAQFPKDISAVINAKNVNPLHPKTPLSFLIEKIESIADLDEGWDGYSALPIRHDVINDAVTFLKCFPSDFALPSVSPTPDNEILMVWEKGDDVLLISVSGDSTYNGYSEIDTKETIFENEPISLTSIAPELTDIVSHFC